MDLIVLAGIATVILLALIFTTLQLLDQSEKHVKDVTETKVRQKAFNEFFPRSNECDLQAKLDAERDPNRVELRYHNFNFTEEGFKQISRMRKLQRLWLIDCDAKDAWLQHLSKLPLNLMIIEGTDLTSDCLKHITKIKTLSTLGLARNPITDDGLEQLYNLPLLQNINLGETDVTARGIKKVCRIENLETVGFMGVYTTGESLADLAKLKRLQILDFGQIPRVTPTQILHLKDLDSLWKVNFRRCDLTDDCVKALGMNHHVAQLEIDGNDLTDKSLTYIKDMKSVSLVRLQNNPNVTKEAVERLKRARPGMVVDIRFTSPIPELNE